MLNELLGKEVMITMGISARRLSGFDDNVKGKIVAIDDLWLKLVQKKDSVYINISHIKRIVPQ